MSGLVSFSVQPVVVVGSQAGDVADGGVEMLAPAVVTGQYSPVLQVSDHMLDADPLRQVPLQTVS
ncbi:hypothetical protein [Micromonospora sp. NPDC048947]|uniref:hypothetical protein n=1 Tax=Micromonospora sp. NPDC048947 TaxID=3154826 RepID=UPI0033DCA6F1